MSSSRKALRKAVAKMSNGKEKQKKETDDSLDRLLRQLAYEQDRKYKYK